MWLRQVSKVDGDVNIIVVLSVHVTLIVGSLNFRYGTEALGRGLHQTIYIYTYSL